MPYDPPQKKAVRVTKVQLVDGTGELTVGQKPYSAVRLTKDTPNAPGFVTEDGAQFATGFYEPRSEEDLPLINNGLFFPMRAEGYSKMAIYLSSNVAGVQGEVTYFVPGYNVGIYGSHEFDDGGFGDIFEGEVENGRQFFAGDDGKGIFVSTPYVWVYPGYIDQGFVPDQGEWEINIYRW